MKKKELIIYISAFVGIFILGVTWSILVSYNVFDKIFTATASFVKI